jgi:L-threonylcarbamoyladenylate synthase
MTTRVFKLDPAEPDQSAIREAASVLDQGGLVAFATETVYGLGAIATNPSAVARIFAAKGRPAFNPVIVHVAGQVEAQACVAEWPESAARLAITFWPGPLTLVLPRADGIPDEITAGGRTVGLRVPASPVALALIRATRQPIAAPSANRSNAISPTRAEHVLASLDGRIDLILDSGPTTVGLESTVLDLSTDPPKLLRPGPITVAELERVLHHPVMTPSDPGAASARPTSPGQLAIHYAPRTPAYRVESAAELGDSFDPISTIILAFGHVTSANSAGARHTFAIEDPVTASRDLYSVLHQCDALGLAAIIVIMPPDHPEWLAVRDRLLRATQPLAVRN